MQRALLALDVTQPLAKMVRTIKDAFWMCCQHTCNIHVITPLQPGAPPFKCTFHDADLSWKAAKGQNVTCPEQQAALAKLFRDEILPGAEYIAVEGLGTVTTNKVESAFSLLRRFKDKDDVLTGARVCMCV